MIRTLAPALLLLAPAPALAQHDHSQHHAAAGAADAHLVVTINPEARVSVVRAAPLPPAGRCGAPVAIKVEVVNQGFVTSPLQAELAADDADVELHMDAAKLSGRTRDIRVLHLTPLAEGATDVAIRFNLPGNFGSMGDRDRVRLLVRCAAAKG